MRLPTARPGRRPLLTLALSSVALLMAATILSIRDAPAPPAAQAPRESAHETYGRIPLGFEANRGQTDASVNFLARGAGYTLFLRPTEAVFVLRSSNSGTREEEFAGRPPSTDALLKPEAPHSKANQQSAVSNPQSQVLRMRLVGADAAAEAAGADELPGKANYLVGNDPSKWRTGVPIYGRVRYAEVYPGVDVVYYGNQRQLEYDFVVAPGRDPRAVSLSFDGADKVEVDGRGDLLLSLGETLVRQPRPFVYQEVAGARRAVETGYAVERDGRVGFSVGEYDASLPLVIDPVLVYSTYLGGSIGTGLSGGGSDYGYAIAVDSAGAAYVTGDANSTNFPTANAIQATHGGNTYDAFVTKLNPAGNALVYSTYLGGSGHDLGRSVAVDGAGNAYVAGATESTNFPTANAIQTTRRGVLDAYVAKLDASGTALIYSTYFGGSSGEGGESITVDSAGAAYVFGGTSSTDFPTANAFQATYGGSGDAFLMKLNPAGNALVYSTYLGGDGEERGHSVAVDGAGNAYVAGTTSSPTTFPTANALQCARSGGRDGYVAKLNAAGTALAYSSYLGGTDDDEATAIGLDSAGNIYLAGYTRSHNFPTVGAIQGTFGGDGVSRGFGDAFVTKVSDATTAPASQLQFTQTVPSVQEGVTFVTMTVQRTGDTTQAVTVDYATSDGTASERSDYTTALGTLRFAAGETTKTFDLLVNEDAFAEGNESFTVALSNATGGGALSCLTAVATVQITDDGTEPSMNAIDDATVFVGTHYHDFLYRQADVPGLTFWESQITACGTDAACLDRKRTDVSQAFFLSIEFQNTGYFVFRAYRASFTDSLARPRGMPRYREFLRDQQEVGRGVVVGVGNWEQQLDANKLEFLRRWVQRPDFVAEFPVGMNADAYVNKLFANLGVTPSPTDIEIAHHSYSDTVEGRARTVRNVIELNSVYNRQFNEGFVLSQYIGYLRRNPNDAPDNSYAGFDYWLAKLDSFSLPGEDVRDEQTAIARVNRAEMVRAFIRSAEYRGRFGP